jgi:uncharacterized membrane protein YczE
VAPLRGNRLPRRLVQLYLGLVAYGVSMAMVLRSELGNIPWDVLHQGLAERTGLSFGLVTIGVGFVVLLLWIPLRERPGLGTVSNVLVIGVVVDATLAVLPHLQVGAGREQWALRGALLLGGVVLNGAATAAYIESRFGPGPRDGLMTGVVRRSGGSVRLVRTGIEVLVVAAGWLLGGTFGAGTVLYALMIGPIAQFFLPRFAVPPAGHP